MPQDGASGETRTAPALGPAPTRLGNECEWHGSESKVRKQAWVRARVSDYSPRCPFLATWSTARNMSATSSSLAPEPRLRITLSSSCSEISPSQSWSKMRNACGQEDARTGGRQEGRRWVGWAGCEGGAKRLAIGGCSAALLQTLSPVGACAAAPRPPTPSLAHYLHEVFQQRRGQCLQPLDVLLVQQDAPAGGVLQQDAPAGRAPQLAALAHAHTRAGRTCPARAAARAGRAGRLVAREVLAPLQQLLRHDALDLPRHSSQRQRLAVRCDLGAPPWPAPALSSALSSALSLALRASGGVPPPPPPPASSSMR
jgi:hypothetical protein